MFSINKMLHIMQLEGYKDKDYINWVAKNKKKAFKTGGIQFLIILGAFALMQGLNALIIYFRIKVPSNILIVEDSLFTAFFIIINMLNILKMRQELKTAKKPLVYTARVKRLIFSNFIIMILLEALFYSYFINNNLPFVTTVIYSFMIFLIPMNMVIANWFIAPTEEMFNRHYINSAARKIRKNKKLIKIGITGSYGKTSTKFILETILKEKFKVLATPESYNTTMGNVRTIREKLNDEHEIFISEMGARNRYDIKEICDFVRPDIGIITSIGPQHLETFKKIENVIKTKYELIEGLSPNGVAFLPKDNKYCYELYLKEKREKYLYSMKDKIADVYAKDVVVNEKGSTFTVVTKDGSFECTTKLLGEHNVENILGGIAIALYLGLSKEQIKAGVSKIEAVPHRLQILPTSNGTIVIDDAFNSNPVGSKMALDILKKFSGRKIIITPGMVELGEKEYELNKEFGEHMASSVDIAILVGAKRSKPIEEGLKSGKFNDNNIYIVNDLNEATKKLAEVSKAGDVVLFENDLPDNYNE
jgi:UDP-N-acetylmuramoyl-tripeptide--D-alanyl-D-alanine ligase